MNLVDIIKFCSSCFKIIIYDVSIVFKSWLAKAYFLFCTCFKIITSNENYLQGNNISYQDQALFSFVFWPFSLKLIWAPIVDGAYFKSIGRRKSWLMPSQLTIALVMYALSTK